MALRPECRERQIFFSREDAKSTRFTKLEDGLVGFWLSAGKNRKILNKIHDFGGESAELAHR